ncbi:hypothetical protein WN943_014404 [Citrus x changshan-huyou]
MCNAFNEVADIAFDDENSYKMVLDWIEKAMKDLSNESVERIVTGKVSYSSNSVQLVLNDPIVTRRKGCPSCIRKESSIHKKYVQRNKVAQKNKDLQETTPSAYHVPNEISTQESNMDKISL